MRSFAALERAGALEIVRNGYLRLGHRAEDMAAFARSVAIQRDLGVADCRVVGKGELRRLVPDLRVDDLAGGLFGPSDGYIDGHAYCDALAAAVRARGGRVLQDTELLGCDPRPATASDSRRVRASSSATSWSTPPAAGPAASATSWARRSRSCRSGTRR